MIFEIFDEYWSFRKSIAVVMLFTIRDGINTLFWIDLLFIFELNWVVLSNNSIFCSEEIFLFPILFFELVFSCRSDSRPEFESLYFCRTMVSIEVILFFIFNMCCFTIFRSYDNFVGACIFISELFCFWLVLVFGDLRFVGDGINVLFFAISILLLSILFELVLSNISLFVGPCF